MKFAIVKSTMQDLVSDGRKKKKTHHVEVLKNGAARAHVHTGTNAIPQDTWDAVKDSKQAVALLASGDLEFGGYIDAPKSETPPQLEAPKAQA